MVSLGASERSRALEDSDWTRVYRGSLQQIKEAQAALTEHGIDSSDADMRWPAICGNASRRKTT